MTKIIVLSFFIFTYFNNRIIAQNTENVEINRSLVYIEAGGAGGYGSSNYEYLVKKINKLKLSVRIGLSTYNFNDYTNNFNPDIIIPLTINAYYGNNHNVDFGFGQTITNIVYANSDDYQLNRTNSLSTNLSIGYRYQKETGGMMYKIAYSPIIENNNTFRHSFLLAFGYKF